MIGSRVSVIWDPPADPKGVIQFYTLHYTPPIPPIAKVVAVTNSKGPVTATVHGYFKPNNNYSFWVSRLLLFKSLCPVPMLATFPYELEYNSACITLPGS